GAIAQAQAIAAQYPDDTTIVVLIADGGPTTCNVDWAAVASAAAQGFAGLPSIQTHAVALSAPTELPNFDEVAQAGGTVQAYDAPDGNLEPILDQIVAAYPCP